jgi:hypothetical protein
VWGVERGTNGIVTIGSWDLDAVRHDVVVCQGPGRSRQLQVERRNMLNFSLRSCVYQPLAWYLVQFAEVVVCNNEF